MYVALIANSAWLDEELPSFQQLVVGLIGEHTRVAQVVPQYLSHDDSSVFGERVLWQESRWELANRMRLRYLDRRLADLGVDLLHALDGRLWHGTALLARAMNAPAVFSANSYLDVRKVDAIARMLSPSQFAFTATTAPIAEAIRDRLDPAYTVETIPPGAHPGETVRQRRPEDAICAVISGDGRLDARYDALLEGLASVVPDHPGTQFFFDGQGSDQHQIWHKASQLNLLPNLSMIPRRLGHRELLVRADVLVQPQPLGLSRGLTIQAMAHGMPLIAQDDPWLDYLLDGETARVVHSPTPKQWAEQFRWVIEQPEDALQLGQHAQGWVREHRLASQHIDHNLNLYQRLAGHAIPFPG